MSSSTTLQLVDFRNAVRNKADIQNSQFITDSELNFYINQSIFELYDILIQKYGDNYYVQVPYSFVTDGTSQFYNLPPDFYKLLGVDLALSNTLDSFVTIKPFNFSDRNRYAVPNFQSFYGVTNLRYRLNGKQLWLTPIPAQGQTIRLFYIPEFVTLVADTDTFDGISGWSEYVIIDAAIKCMQKEESDVTTLMAQKQMMLARIESAAANRDAGSPATVADTQYGDMWYPSGSGSGYGSGSY